MQIRCTYCQTMFAISREDMLSALEQMDENKQIYHPMHCPKCRRANRVERMRMERFFPEWKKVLKTMEKEAVAAEHQAEKTTAAAAPKAAAKVEKKTASKPNAKVGAGSAKGKTAGTKKK
jgi:predicted  nucleic acid-binding Zn-ribbon protein